MNATMKSVKVPSLGFGTWQLKGDLCREAVEDALKIGYRHIDTAQIYGNEEEVGAAIKASGISRDEIFLTTKVWNDKITKREILDSVEESLRKLGTDHVDLLLIHWPVENQRTIGGAMEGIVEAMEQGRTRFVGVSNFTATQFKESLKHGPVACNQVEYHPLLAQDELLELCRANDAILTAYSPLAQGAKELLEAKGLLEVAQAVGRTPHQVVLRWGLQQSSVCAIPRSSKSKNRKANFEALDFELTPGQMETITNLNQDHRFVNPSFGPQEWK